VAAADDEFAIAVAIPFLRREAHAAALARIKGKEVGDWRGLCQIDFSQSQEAAGKDEDARPAARPAAEGEVRVAIAVEVAGRHERPVAEGDRIGPGEGKEVVENPRR